MPTSNIQGVVEGETRYVFQHSHILAEKVDEVKNRCKQQIIDLLSKLNIEKPKYCRIEQTTSEGFHINEEDVTDEVLQQVAKQKENLKQLGITF